MVIMCKTTDRQSTLTSQYKFIGFIGRKLTANGARQDWGWKNQRITPGEKTSRPLVSGYVAKFSLHEIVL